MTTSAPYNVCNGGSGAVSTDLVLTVGTGTGSPAGTSAADMIYVLTSEGLAENPSTVFDSQGNTYTAQVTPTTGQQRVQLWTSPGGTALVSGTDTVTVRYPSSNGNRIAIVCGVPGIASATADTSHSGTATSGTAASSGSSGTLSQASEVVVGGIRNQAAGNPLTALSFGTALAVTQAATMTEFHEVVSSVAAQTASGTLNASAQWGALIATFKISLPSVTTTGLPNATSGSAYSQALSVGGGLPSYTWSIISGSLTGSGITMSSAGVFSGTATGGSASYPVTVQVSDGNGNTATKALTLTVTGTGFTSVQNGTAQSGTGSVTTTLPAASTAGNLLVAAVEAAGAGPFTAPAGWQKAVSAGGSAPVLLGEHANGFAEDVDAGVTGLTISEGFATAGPHFPSGWANGWPSGIWDSRVKTQILCCSVDEVNTVNGTYDSQIIAMLAAAPTGAWLMPDHEPNLSGGPSAALCKTMDIYVLALKNNHRPDIQYGRGFATGPSTAFDPATYLDTGYSYTSTSAAPAVFTVSANPLLNGCSVTLGSTGCPAGFTPNKVYYVVNVSGNTFQLSATVGGTGVTASSTGTGTVAPAPDFYGFDGYQHASTKADHYPDGLFDTQYGLCTGVNPNCKIAIIETGTALPEPPGVTNWCVGTAGGPAGFDGLLAWAKAHPNLIGINMWWSTPGTPLGGSQPWQNSFVTPMNALSAGLAAIGGANDIELWYYLNAPVTSSAVFTGPGGVTCRGAMAEFASPAGTTQALDTTGTNAGPAPATTLPVTASVSSGTGDLGVAAWGNWFTANPGGTWTSPAGWSRAAAFASGGASLFDMEYKTGLASGVQSVSGIYSTSTGQTTWGGVLATFKAIFSSPVITTSSPLPAGTAGTAYTAPAMTATGGTAPYTWSAGTGKPAGVLLSSAGTWSGTPSAQGAYTFAITATDQNGAAGTKTFTLSVAQQAPAGNAFPASPLGTGVELLINGTWTDITSYVYARDGISITGGTSEQGTTPQPAQATLTLSNRDGSFSPANPAGQFYPYLQRNIQMRISVTALSATGASYSGYRFWGKVTEWPPQSDVSGQDVYVQVTANGPLREISQGGGKGGALFRYYQNLVQQDAANGTFTAPVAYWPCEEDPDSNVIGAGIDGGMDMAVTTARQPVWKTNNSFNGSAPMGCPNKSTWDGFTGAFGTSGDDIFAAPGIYNWVASTTSVTVNAYGGGGGGTKGQQPTGGGNGGGGGEFAKDTVAVTPGNVYQVAVGSGGAAGNWNAGGSNGSSSSFAGDTATVTAHGGQGATASGASGGQSPGGTGSAAGVHHDGGKGGYNAATLNGGAGGGGSGGSTGAGGNGQNSQVASNATGGTAGTGSPAGAAGGFGGYQVPGQAGRAPAAGGGGGWANQSNHTLGGSGAPGQVELTYVSSTSTAPPWNVVRFLMQIPPWGGQNGGVLIRFFTAVQVANSNLTKLDVVYVSPGKIQLKGYTGTGGSTLNFTTSSVTVGDGTTAMVSVELQNNSSGGVRCLLKAIAPGAPAIIGSVSATVANSVIASVTEVLVSPNQDITKTAIGHISVQYQQVDLARVSDVINGHFGEMGIDRFIRLCGEQALDNAVEFAEQSDHWGFEGGVQSWSGSGHNCAVTTSTFAFISPNGPASSWPAQGVQSLLATSTVTGAFDAYSPAGIAGQPVNPGDIVTAGADVFAPAGASAAYIGIKFFDNTGAALAETDSAAVTLTANNPKTLKGKAVAPVNAQFFNIHVGNSDAATAPGTVFYIDNVRVSPRMGTQTREAYQDYLEQVKDLEQGLIKEAKELWGLKYRTRIRMTNQPVALALDYSAGQVAPPLQPVQDDKLTVNQVTVHRKEGSRVTVSQSSGNLSVQAPPKGVGKHAKQAKVVAEDDGQLLALASHLLDLGTDVSTRYPVITVNLASAAVAGKFAAIGLAEIGDRIQVTNLPFWYPETITDQVIIGYSEVLNSYEWTIAWNCTPATPWNITITSIRRW